MIPSLIDEPTQDVGSVSPCAFDYKWLPSQTRWNNPVDRGKYRKARQQRAAEKRRKKK